MFNPIKPALLMLMYFSALTGIIYPLIVTFSAQAFLPRQANGSLIIDDNNQALGSELIGQAFSRPEYFWGRPSATSPHPYNAGASSGANQGPANPALLEAVQTRIKALRNADPKNTKPIPVDLVTASASGLDPDISPAAAVFQIERIAAARHLPVPKVQELVKRYTEPRLWRILGEPRVNVLKLNLALDQRLK
ncbi:potassium-transporting ATPase subunit KdpC [Candidatus Methylobacter favarea]|uniref:potassium-transporting ATPase subunit KdpC n=1 Tax=Candidatus Methylobacter favarea TaxID=2707345 RepID=UPI00157D10D1|nr:potassium-transporting ATPase subunit KdpC [Candidatus Methylobacter favarea]